MSKSIVRAACGLLILLVVIAGLAACTTTGEPDYANQIAESALQGMSAGDYAKHMEHFSPDFQSTVSEATFDTGSQIIQGIIGYYIDKEFWYAEIDKEFWYAETSSVYTVVYYRARFSEEPAGVTAMFYFEEIDGEMYIAGFDLDSPKLREFRGE